MQLLSNSSQEPRSLMFGTRHDELKVWLCKTKEKPQAKNDITRTWISINIQQTSSCIRTSRTPASNIICKVDNIQIIRDHSHMEPSILRVLSSARRSNATCPRLGHQCTRTFSQSTRCKLREQSKGVTAENSTSQGQPAANLSQNVGKEEKDHYEKVVEHSKQSQMRAPWMREGSDKPPVARMRSAGAMVKSMMIRSSTRIEFQN
jgi:hypothetical protein